MGKPILTAEQIAAAYRETNPDIRFAVSKDGSAVGMWTNGRFVEFMMKTITPTFPWVNLIGEDGMIHTTKANGKALYAPEDWTEV